MDGEYTSHKMYVKSPASICQLDQANTPSRPFACLIHVVVAGKRMAMFEFTDNKEQCTSNSNKEEVTGTLYCQDCSRARKVQPHGWKMRWLCLYRNTVRGEGVGVVCTSFQTD